jgi:hypothetical protein
MTSLRERAGACLGSSDTSAAFSHHPGPSIAHDAKVTIGGYVRLTWPITWSTSSLAPGWQWQTGDRQELPARRNATKEAALVANPPRSSAARRCRPTGAERTLICTHVRRRGAIIASATRNSAVSARPWLSGAARLSGVVGFTLLATVLPACTQQKPVGPVSASAPTQGESSPQASSSARAAGPDQALPSRRAIAFAVRWLRRRGGVAALAVIDSHGLRGTKTPIRHLTSGSLGCSDALLALRSRRQVLRPMR